MISVRIEGATVEDVHAQMRAMLGVDGPTPAPAPKTTKKEATEKVASKPAETSAAPKDATEVPFAAVSAVIPKLVAKKGKPAAVALLEKYGAKKGGDLKADQYASFVGEAEALLA